MPDGNIRDTEENRLKLIEVFREHRPEIVFGFYNKLTRHPDHYFAGQLVKECMFLAGLKKLRSTHPAHRPSALIYFKGLENQERPDFIVDISEVWEQKIQAIQAYTSQVSVEKVDESNVKTIIRTQAFWEILEAQSRIAGAMIGTKYGESFYCDAPANIADIPAAFKR
jgi:LmbE family N-acetylglucosaminyl deacetylase